MFFREYCEFIEALYIIYYSKMNDYEKNINYRKIRKSYEEFGKINNDFEEIYDEITTGAVYNLKESDLTFLRRYNGLLLSISRLLNLKIKLHYLDNCTFVKKMYSVELIDDKYHCLQCDNSNQNLFFSFENNKLILTGISENAKIKEELATIQEGENLKISLNVKFLVDYISIIGGKVTELKLLNSKSSVVVKDEADDKSVYFTMPLALRE